MSACARPVLAAFCAMIIAIASTPAATDVPQILSYQGKLTDSSGLPVADGIHTLTFAVYSAETRGSLLWIENGRKVQVSGGLFSVLLGEVEPLPAGGFPSDAWLETRVGTTAVTPRVRLASVPSALRAHTAENVQPGAVVTSLNSLAGAVTIAAGDNLSLTQTGDTITLSGESIPNPLPVSQSGAWNVGIAGTPTVKTPTQSNYIQLWPTQVSIAPGAILQSQPIECEGYRELRLRLHLDGKHVQPELIRIDVRCQAFNNAWVLVGSANFGVPSVQPIPGANFTQQNGVALLTVPVYGPRLMIDIVNNRDTGTFVSLNSAAYLVN